MWRTLVLLSVGMLLWQLLSWSLQPDPRGLGTHEQLGLPACSLRERLGFDCPTCGVTTSVVLTGRGQILAALRTQALGPLLVLTLVVLWLRALTLFPKGRAHETYLPLLDRRLLYAFASLVLLCWWLRVAV